MSSVSFILEDYKKLISGEIDFWNRNAIINKIGYTCK